MLSYQKDENIIVTKCYQKLTNILEVTMLTKNFKVVFGEKLV